MLILSLSTLAEIIPLPFYYLIKHYYVDTMICIYNYCITFTSFFRPCSWVNDIPQGFSCAVGAEPNECSGQYERFVPVECDEIVLKVAKKIFDCNGDPDCFEGVNWG